MSDRSNCPVGMHAPHIMGHFEEGRASEIMDVATRATKFVCDTSCANSGGCLLGDEQVGVYIPQRDILEDWVSLLPDEYRQVIIAICDEIIEEDSYASRFKVIMTMFLSKAENILILVEILYSKSVEEISEKDAKDLISIILDESGLYDTEGVLLNNNVAFKDGLLPIAKVFLKKFLVVVN